MHRREDAPLPLRRAGQLARADRGAAGEQRPADRARDARRHAVQERPRPRRTAARRGTRRSACRARGTSSGRCGCSRCWPSSPTCWSTTTSSRARRSIEAKVAELVDDARAEMDRVQAMGGAIAAVESGYMKQALVSSHAARRAADRERRGHRRRRQPVRDHRALAAHRRPRRRHPGRRPARPSGPRSPALEAWRAERDQAEVDRALEAPGRRCEDRRQPDGGRPWSPRAPGATTGEWAGTLREVFGEFRAPTGVSGAVGVAEAGAGAHRGARAGARDR